MWRSGWANGRRLFRHKPGADALGVHKEAFFDDIVTSATGLGGCGSASKWLFIDRL